MTICTSRPVIKMLIILKLGYIGFYACEKMKHNNNSDLQADNFYITLI
jgi:hypothetical protein